MQNVLSGEIIPTSIFFKKIYLICQGYRISPTILKKIMKHSFLKGLIGGFVGTVAITIVGYLAPLMGLPKMSPPQMLSDMIGFSIAIGWIMHFMIGMFFGVIYATLFIKAVRKIHSKVLKGTLYGIAVFVFAQIMIALISSIMPSQQPPPTGSMVPMMMGSIIGHLVFGIVTALIATSEYQYPRKQNLVTSKI